MFLKKIAMTIVLAALSAGAAEFSLQEQANRLGWFFAPGEPVTATLTLDRPQSDAPQLVLTDFFGKQSEIPVEFAPGSTLVRFPVPTDRPGYFIVSAPGLKLEQALAVAPDNTRFSTPESPFGCNVHLTRIPYQEAVREIEIARRVGFGWLRGVTFDWADLRERKDADLRFRQFAPLNEFLRKSGIGVLGTIHYVARYASGAPAESEAEVWSRVAPTDWADLTEIAARYAKELDFVTHWEIMNEPDAELFWRGSWKNYLANDDRAIIRDAVAYHAAARAGIKASNPEAKILYMGVTSAAPKGATYQPFLQETLNAGIAANFDIMNIHYIADIAEIRKLLAPCGAAERPIWITEIGTHSAGGSSERLQLIRDLTTQLEQLACGAAKVFKYDLRNDGVTSHHEHNFGLIRRDFSPKPNFVALATMAGLLHDMKSAAVLNLVHAPDAGYCKGFAFDSASHGRVNAIVLCDAPRAVVTLNTPDEQVTVTDVMGVSRQLKAENGRIKLEMDDLPLFVSGRITEEAGKPVYPGDVTVRVYPMTPRPLLTNGSFEAGAAHWQNLLGDAGKVGISTDRPADGKQSLVLKIPAPGASQFVGIGQKVDLVQSIGPLAKNEYAVFKLTGLLRRENLVGRGVSLGVAFLDSSGQRFAWRESPYRAGSHDWRPVEVTGTIPESTAALRISCDIAPKTTGAVALDQLSLSIEIRRKPLLGKQPAR